MPDSLTSPLEPITTKDRVAELIKSAMLSGQLKSGQRIVELRLAKDLGLATTSIREALFELERQGFVTRITNKGAYVTELSNEDVQQIYEVRGELEGFALVLFMERAGPGDFDEFGKILARMRVSARAGDSRTFYAADLEFHRTLWRLSGNRYIYRCLDSIVAPLFAFYVATLERTTDQLIRHADRHQEIIDAIRLEDKDKAREVLRQSLTQVFWQT